MLRCRGGGRQMALRGLKTGNDPGKRKKEKRGSRKRTRRKRNVKDVGVDGLMGIGRMSVNVLEETRYMVVVVVVVMVVVVVVAGRGRGSGRGGIALQRPVRLLSVHGVAAVQVVAVRVNLASFLFDLILSWPLVVKPDNLLNLSLAGRSSSSAHVRGVPLDRFVLFLVQSQRVWRS